MILNEIADQLESYRREHMCPHSPDSPAWQILGSLQRKAGWFWIWRQENEHLHFEGFLPSDNLGEHIQFSLKRLSRVAGKSENAHFWFSWAQSMPDYPDNSSEIMDGWWKRWGTTSNHIELSHQHKIGKLPLDCALAYEQQIQIESDEPTLSLSPDCTMNNQQFKTFIQWIRTCPLPIHLDLSALNLDISEHIESGALPQLPELFANCTSLVELSLPFEMTHLDNDAFTGCTNLRKIICSSETATIGRSCFLDCPSLTIVELPWHLNADVIDAKICFPPGIALFWRKQCTHKDGWKIPDSTCKAMTITGNLPDVPQEWRVPEEYRPYIEELIVMKEVTIIRKGQFAFLPRLRTIKLPINKPTIEDGAFIGCINVSRL